MGHRRSFHIVFALLVTCFCLSSPAYTQPSGYEDYQVVRIEITAETELDTLRSLLTLYPDFELWSEALGIGPMDVRVAPPAVPLLDAADLCYDVLIADLQKHIDELYGVHEGRGGNFFDVLRTYDEHVQFMTDLVAAYPDLAEMINLGLSVQGRPLWALRITGPGAGDKPGVMYNGAQHGNEQAGASVVAYAAQHLLTNYDTDPDIATLVDSVEWFLLPIMNPDGYVAFERRNAHNVDLNRNWGGPGSGEDPAGGPYPFSEPETTAMRDFFLQHTNVGVHVDFHGYIDWILWPWGHSATWCQDHWTFHILGWQVHDLIWGAGGGSYEVGTPGDVGYLVSGGSMSYSYAVAGNWAFTFELANSSLPSICEEFQEPMLFLATWISDCDQDGLTNAEEIAAGTSNDFNLNGVPDECEADCNGNAIADPYELEEGLSLDCNQNLKPDECDIAEGTSGDCNANQIPDECDLASGTSEDCNENHVPDECDVASGVSTDVNGNGIPDECEPDCNENGVPDDWDIFCGTSEDCDANGVPDECQPDCNNNGTIDACDILDGTSDDADGDGIPDECEFDCASTEAHKLGASDGTSSDYFGHAVATYGNTVLIGAYGDSDNTHRAGSAYVFERVADGFLELAKLTLQETVHDRHFGYAVALSGDTAVVGAPGDDGLGYWGKACTLQFDGSSWTAQSELAPADGTSGDQFGSAVDILDDTIVIGAPKDSENGADSGAAYVYGFSDGTWSRLAKLTAFDAAPYDRFGSSVSISGDTILIGAPATYGTSGAAYVFRQIGPMWIPIAKLTPSDGESGDCFGHSVALAANTAIIGACFDDDKGSASGSVYVLCSDGVTWAEAAKLTASDGEADDRFGCSVTISANTVLIGAYQERSDSIRAGAAYIFGFDEATWVEQAKLTPSDGAYDDRFGCAVALSADAALIGAPRNDHGAYNSGSAYAFSGISNCNNNGLLDICDIENGESQDLNANGIPDECECWGDLDGDNDVDLADLAQLLGSYGETTGMIYEDGDLDGDADVDLADLAELLGVYGTVCAPCPGDLDGDNDVDLADLAQLLGSYGESTGMSYEDGDLDGDGDVDLADLAELLGHYGEICE